MGGNEVGDLEREVIVQAMTMRTSMDDNVDPGLQVGILGSGKTYVVGVKKATLVGDDLVGREGRMSVGWDGETVDLADSGVLNEGLENVEA